MSKQEKSIKSFSEQHKLSVSKIHPLSAVDFNTYRLHEILNVKSLSGMKILDVGCGTGRVTNCLIASNPSEILSIDPSISDVDFHSFVIEKNRKFPGQIRFSQSSALNFETNEKFDVIFIVGVLHHIPESVATLRNLRNFLSPSGQIVIWVYSKEIGRFNLMALTILRSVFQFMGPLKIPFTKLLRKILKISAFFTSKRSEIRMITVKDSEESILALFDQLNAGYAKYYSMKDLEEEARLAGLVLNKTLATGRKGWTVALSNP